MVARKPVLYKGNVSCRCPNSLQNYYQLVELAGYVGQTPEAVLDNGVNGGPLVPIRTELDLVVANCGCGTCLGDHLVQDMGTEHYVHTGQTVQVASTHRRQWHAHNSILAFDWRFFLDPKLVQNVYVPEAFGNYLMANCQKACGRYGDAPEARIGRDTGISGAFWNDAECKGDPRLSWAKRDFPALGNEAKVPML
jgi:hypothetical protein